MPFSKEDKAVTTNLYQFKKYGSRRIVTEFSKINCKREELDTYLKKHSGNKKHRPQALERQTKARAYWRERDHSEWTDRPTKPGRPETNTSFNTPDIQIDGTVQHHTLMGGGRETATACQSVVCCRRRESGGSDRPIQEGEGEERQSTVARKCSAARYMPVCSGGHGACIQACQPPMCRCAPM